MSTDAAWAIWVGGLFVLIFFLMVSWLTDESKTTRIWATAIFAIWALPVLLRAYLMVLAS